MALSVVLNPLTATEKLLSCRRQEMTFSKQPVGVMSVAI